MITLFKYSVLEALRKKFFIFVVLSCFVILLLSFALGQMSLDSKERLTVNFGLTAIQLLLLFQAVFFGSGIFLSDRSQRIWLLLSRPLRPASLFFSRYLSLSFLLFLSLFFMSLILLSFFLFLKIEINTVLFQTLFGLFLESLLLLSFVLLFASFSQAFLVSFYGISIFIVGHFVETLSYFLEKMPESLSLVLSFFIKFIPNLERINWKSEVTYQDEILWSEFFFSSFYAFLWLILVLSVSFLILEKRQWP